MELRHMRYFEAVARHCHVTRAAAELHIAQPALSKQISQLEQELGVALFDRVGRNVRLTEAGEALLPHIRAVLSQVEAARAEIDDRLGLRRGRVSLGISTTVGMHLLPPTLAAFNRRYPGVELHLHEASMQALLDLMETGLVDTAVLTLPVDDPALTVIPLLTEDIVVIIPADHAMAHRTSVILGELCAEPWILSPDNYQLREITLNVCSNAGFTPRVVLDGGDMDTLVRMVVTGLGIALVPRTAVSDSYDLAVLNVQDQTLQRSLGLAWRSQRVASPAARALREFLAEQLVGEMMVEVRPEKSRLYPVPSSDE